MIIPNRDQKEGTKTVISMKTSLTIALSAFLLSSTYIALATVSPVSPQRNREPFCEDTISSKSTLITFSVGKSAAPASSPCPSCDNPAGWTLKTKTENGRVFYEYKCVMGHTHWVLVK